MCSPVSWDSGIDSTHGDRYTPPAIRSRAASTSASVITSASERQLGVGFHVVQHAPELALDALERARVLRFEAQHDDRRRVRCARKTEAVRIFDAQAVDADHVGRAGKLRARAK